MSVETDLLQGEHVLQGSEESSKFQERSERIVCKDENVERNRQTSQAESRDRSCESTAEQNSTSESGTSVTHCRPDDRGEKHEKYCTIFTGSR